MSNKRTSSRKSSQTKILTGKLDISRGGMGYVIVEGQDKDVLVRPNEFGRAFHGDTVKVQVNTDIGNKRPEGKITDVIHRATHTFLGNIQHSKSFAFFIPATDKPMPDFFISLDKLNGAEDGNRVVVKMTKWDKKEKKPEGEVVSILNASDVNDMAMKELLIENGFPIEFDKQAIHHAAHLSGVITREELSKRKDFRDFLTFTIDPVDAKDFDDAISIRNMDNGNYEIGVHIADVSHFVKEGSDLDKVAYERATSVYLPDRVNPMLPEKISNELCSLRPKEDKYAFSVIFQINNRAEIKSKWIGRTVIHSDHRYTYDDVQEIIETEEGLNCKAILLLNSLAKQFRAKRFENGAINFSSQEIRFQLDEKGKPIGIIVKESKDAHKLIEEFMLLANRTVAEYVSRIKVNGEPIPFPYRIHDEPDDEKLIPFAAFAKKFGYKFDLHNKEVVAQSFNALLKDITGKPEQHVLEQLGIRTMSKAAYTQTNIGHYGLGFENYCHFTSPIRRYPDVMVHRIVQQCLDKQLKVDKKMAEKCKHCSDRERKAMESERAGNKYKQVEFMMNYLGEEFEGIISGVASFGFFVETILHKCEGMVSVKDLGLIDDFRLDEAEYALIGAKTGIKFRMGDKVMVKVAAANLEKRQLDFQWINASAAKNPPKTTTKSKKKKKD